MDSEILQLLKSMNNKIEQIDNKIDKMDSRIDKIDNKIEQMDNRIDTIDNKINKNTILLEQLNKKVEIVAEVQTAHKEQNEQMFETIQNEHENKTTLITSSLKSVSDDVIEVKSNVKELKEKFDKVEKVTIQNTYDVAYLKSVK